MPKTAKNLAAAKKQGFSLVELTMVIVIVLVIASMAIPSVMSMIRELRTAGDVRDLNGAIVLAKMRAASSFSRARVRTASRRFL